MGGGHTIKTAFLSEVGFVGGKGGEQPPNPPQHLPLLVGDGGFGRLVLTTLLFLIESGGKQRVDVFSGGGSGCRYKICGASYKRLTPYRILLFSCN